MLAANNITQQFGAKPLFENISQKFGGGNRYGLIGANGCGKSTFMKILTGELKPSSGTVSISDSERLGILRQDQFAYEDFRVVDTVIMGHEKLWEVKKERDRIYALPEMSDEDGIKVGELEMEFAEMDGYMAESSASELLLGLDIPEDQHYGLMSEIAPGWKLRVLLAQALFSDPEILLLDEPTNHLDISSITWLEEFLKSYGGTVLFITHDRTFLQALATRIVQLDRGNLTSYPGDYANFLIRREEKLAEEETQNALFDKKLAQEEVWIRQGIKARRTRNEGRVRALEQLRRERSQRREKVGNVKMQLQDAERSGKLVLEAEDISQSYDGRELFKDFTTVIQRGDRIGVIGKNGCGKSTLLSILLGRAQAESGEVKLGTNLEVAYFDQLRSQLDEEVSVVDNVGQGADHVEINGARKHIIGYLQDFLFTPERARTPVKALSGGERNRLLLAKLFTQPANLLVLDEPTNDLDAETLDLLEDLLMNYQGTLLLVSHDRTFLNNVSTSTIVFDDDGQVREYVGGYDDWLRQRALDKQAEFQKKSTASKVTKTNTSSAKKKSNLTYQEQLDLEALPKKIEQLEQKQDELHTVIGDPDFYQQDADKVTATQDELAALTKELESAYERWEMLEEKQEG